MKIYSSINHAIMSKSKLVTPQGLKNASDFHTPLIMISDPKKNLYNIEGEIYIELLAENEFEALVEIRDLFKWYGFSLTNVKIEETPMKHREKNVTEFANLGYVHKFIDMHTYEYVNKDSQTKLIFNRQSKTFELGDSLLTPTLDLELIKLIESELEMMDNK